jgi:cytochrome c biogenesis protein CcdA
VVLPRPRLQAIGIAAAAVWLPCVLPLLGIVNDSTHALTTYLMCFVVVPGMLVSAILQLEGFWFGVIASSVTAMIFTALYFVARYWPRPSMQVIMVIAAGLLAFEAIGLGHAFRA